MNPSPFDSESSSSQAQYWNNPSIAADLQSRQSGVTEFAVEMEERFPRHARVLELGCSAGDDTAYFAEQGHEVVGLDVSAPLIDIAAQRYADRDNVDFRVADLTKPFGVRGQSMDVVYARLSLHYFDDATTLRVFSEIAWVLRKGGLLAFACRSTKDPLYGKGEEVGPDFFNLDGHFRRFFDADYCSDLLEDNGFTNIEILTGEQKLYGAHSAFVKCTALAC
jgi:SAM-dependent methyltransferase